MSTAASVQPAAAWWRPATKPAIDAAPRRVHRAPASTANVVAFRALVAFTAILLLSPQAWVPALGSLRIAFLAAGTAIAAYLLDRLARQGDVVRVNTEVALASTLVGWAIITLPVSYWVTGSFEVLMNQFLKAVVFFWLVSALTTTPGRLRAMAWTLVLCAIPLAVTGVRNYVFGEVLSTGVPGLTRIYGYMGGSGLVANPNDLALMLNLIIPIAAAMMIGTRGFALRAVAALALMLSIAGVIVTFSRAGFLTLAASAVMMLAVLIRRRSAGAATLLLGVALVAPVLLPDAYFERLSTITNIEADETGSAQGRWADVVASAEIVARNPIVGAGIGNDLLALNEYRDRDTYRSVHNAYLQYAVDLGLPGLLLFAWLHVLCFRNVRRLERRVQRDDALRSLGPLAAGLQVSLVAFFVAAMFHPIAYQFYFFTIAGLAVGLKHAVQVEGAEEPVRVPQRHPVAAAVHS